MVDDRWKWVRWNWRKCWLEREECGLPLRRRRRAFQPRHGLSRLGEHFGFWREPRRWKANLLLGSKWKCRWPSRIRSRLLLIWRRIWKSPNRLECHSGRLSIPENNNNLQRIVSLQFGLTQVPRTCTYSNRWDWYRQRCTELRSNTGGLQQQLFHIGAKKEPTTKIIFWPRQTNILRNTKL